MFISKLHNTQSKFSGKEGNSYIDSIDTSEFQELRDSELGKYSEYAEYVTDPEQIVLIAEAPKNAEDISDESLLKNHYDTINGIEVGRGNPPLEYTKFKEKKLLVLQIH